MAPCLLFIPFLLTGCLHRPAEKPNAMKTEIQDSTAKEYPEKTDANLLTLFLCGDVMTGRGIDQALPHPGDPALHESYIRDARDYLLLAEQENGNIRTPVSYDYIWGEALRIMDERRPDLRLINLETSVTTSDDFQMNKEVLYRMHPGNLPCLAAAGIDGCALANNHVLDWGEKGLIETIETFEKAGLPFAGAGRNAAEAARPATWKLEKGRLVFSSYGLPDSGIPQAWAAKADSPGVNLLRDFSGNSIRKVKADLAPFDEAGSVVVFSVHWGSNWGYHIPAAHRQFARRLIDEAGVDVVHGHSSHHFRGIEVYNNKLILYGCGDLITDYEGISGHEQYRGQLALLYFPAIDPADGSLAGLEMVPVELRQFSLNPVKAADAQWMENVLDREGEKLGTSVERTEEGAFRLVWQ